MYTQSFAACKINLKSLINDLMNDLRYLYLHLLDFHICNKEKNKCKQPNSNKNKK